MLIAATNQQPRGPSCEQECPNVAPKNALTPAGAIFRGIACTRKLIGARVMFDRDRLWEPGVSLLSRGACCGRRDSDSHVPKSSTSLS